jgi:hypothetical protein
MIITRLGLFDGGSGGERETVPITRLLHDLDLMVEAAARERVLAYLGCMIITRLGLFDGGSGGERERGVPITRLKTKGVLQGVTKKNRKRRVFA